MTSDAPVLGATALACSVCQRTAGYRLNGDGGSRPLCFRHLVTAPRVMRRAGLTALVVGTILTTINQGNVILGGDFPSTLFWKIPLTYCVPYCVTTWGVLGGSRLR
jgi:hypothetical protein